MATLGDVDRVETESYWIDAAASELEIVDELAEYMVFC